MSPFATGITRRRRIFIHLCICTSPSPSAASPSFSPSASTLSASLRHLSTCRRSAKRHRSSCFSSERPSTCRSPQRLRTSVVVASLVLASSATRAASSGRPSEVFCVSPSLAGSATVSDCGPSSRICVCLPSSSTGLSLQARGRRDRSSEPVQPNNPSRCRQMLNACLRMNVAALMALCVVEMPSSYPSRKRRCLAFIFSCGREGRVNGSEEGGGQSLHLHPVCPNPRDPNKARYKNLF